MTEYVSVTEDKFKGFTEVPGIGKRELRDYLGISVDPQTRIFYFNGAPRFKWLHLLKAQLEGSKILASFLKDPELRGEYHEKQKAVFVQPDDFFAECHELGHAFVRRENPNLFPKNLSAFVDVNQAANLIARSALSDGIAEWVAIKVGLESGDPLRKAEATRESNKLVAGSEDQVNHLYDPIFMQGNIDKVSKAVAEYCNNPFVRRGLVINDICENYVKMRDLVYRGTMSLGYAYVVSRVGKLSIEQPEWTIAQKLSLLAKNPPTFTELEQEVNGSFSFY